jgi:hypothetical protein
MPENALHRELFARLDTSIETLWTRAKAGPFWRQVVERGCDRELYGQVLGQIVHYTRHNSIHQAVAALRASPDDHPLLRFVYSHAAEELGHEKLALRSGFPAQSSRRRCPPPTH